MDLSTEYLGMTLKNPLVVSASPFSGEIDNFRRLEDAGVAAVVCHSLFEEQILRDAAELESRLEQGTESYAESMSYFPAAEEFILGPEEYLDHIRKAKAAVDIPVIGSLNGHTIGGWTRYAKEIEKAGADALELNIYFLPTDMETDSARVEEIYVGIVRAVTSEVGIPVAVKIGPYFSALPQMARRIQEAGAGALVLFNRFYQPDIDLETRTVIPNLLLSTPQEMRPALRWIAILFGRLSCGLAATGGIHKGEDVLKMLMVGADVTMVCSALLKHGIPYASTIIEDVRSWMETHEYGSVAELRGSLSQRSCGDPEAFERANYMKVLQSFH